jgi:hypothetical protein
MLRINVPSLSMVFFNSLSLSLSLSLYFVSVYISVFSIHKKINSKSTVENLYFIPYLCQLALLYFFLFKLAKPILVLPLVETFYEEIKLKYVPFLVDIPSKN